MEISGQNETANEYKLEEELIALSELARILKYPSVISLRKAYSRGKLPVKLYKFKNRRGMFAKKPEVIRCIESMKEC